jgi:hypothetical protein
MQPWTTKVFKVIGHILAYPNKKICKGYLMSLARIWGYKAEDPVGK